MMILADQGGMGGQANADIVIDLANGDITDKNVSFFLLNSS